MSRVNQRKFTEEFKREAVKLLEQPDVVALMPAATRGMVESGLTHDITDDVESAPHNHNCFFIRVMGFAHVVTSKHGGVA